jgi:hypothetical protein
MTHTINSDKELAMIQDSWSKYVKKIDDIPIIRSERKRRIPLLIPLIGLWAGIVTGGTVVF